MKKVIGIVIVILILAGAGVAGWYFFIKKNPEGGACANDKKCETGLKCVNKICSSGNVGSVCTEKSDCKTDFCVSNKCTEGKENETCQTYKDCQKGLYCKNSLCSTPPSYTKYFNKIEISKIKPGMPPGPNNVPVPTTEFKTTDAIEIDLYPKASVSGEMYYELINAVTGEVEITNKENKMPVKGSQTGTGFAPPNITGEFELNIYFNDELISVTQIEISR